MKTTRCFCMVNISKINLLVTKLINIPILLRIPVIYSNKKLIVKTTLILRKTGRYMQNIPKQSTENIQSVSVFKNTSTENSISVFLNTDTDTEFRSVVPALMTLDIA